MMDLLRRARVFLAEMQGLAAATTSGAVLHWAVLIFHVPVIHQLPRWRWFFIAKPAGALWLIALLIAAGAVLVCLVTGAPGRYGAKILALIALGYALQMGFALLEGRGIDAIRDRIVQRGHAEFAIVAVEQDSVWEVLSDYERLVQAGELGDYARSKPPGHLLLYMLTERVAHLVNAETTLENRVEWFRTFASYAWPLLSYLVLVPMFFLARDLMDSQRAIEACALYLLIPSVNLITLHTDQVFFPALFVTALYLVVTACRKERLRWALAGGVCAYVAVFCSFGLAVVIPIAAALCWALSRDSGQVAWRGLVKGVGGMLAGMAVTGIAAGVVLGYDIWSRYQSAIAFHAEWEDWEPTAVVIFYWGTMSLIEYALLVGVPVTFASLWRIRRSLKEVRRRRWGGMTGVSLGVGAALLFFALFGRVSAESARLWLFLVPCLCAMSVSEMNANPDVRGGGFALVAVLQWMTVYLTKVHQDFW
jgi:hypothetical protein